LDHPSDAGVRAGASHDMMPWLRDRVREFDGVASADLSSDPRGHEILVVNLGAPRAAEAGSEPSAIDSLLQAELAPMLLFDSETLAVVRTNRRAHDVFELHQENPDYSLADMFAPEELERLGERLAREVEEWHDGSDWLMVTRTGRRFTAHNWYAPQNVGGQRLFICAPTLEG
jgi:hypothetical protein